jgi:hypothetical protein
MSDEVVLAARGRGMMPLALWLPNIGPLFLYPQCPAKLARYRAKVEGMSCSHF